jgi:hypothetical protein
LENPANITVDDVVEGELVLNELKKDLTWRALKGQLNDFDQSASKVLAVEDHFDSQLNRLELKTVITKQLAFGAQPDPAAAVLQHALHGLSALYFEHSVSRHGAAGRHLGPRTGDRGGAPLSAAGQ